MSNIDPSFDIDLFVSSLAYKDVLAVLYKQRNAITDRIVAIENLVENWKATQSIIPDVEGMQHEIDSLRRERGDRINKIAKEVLGRYFAYNNDDEFVALYKARPSIDLIKEIRAKANCGLKEAKDAYDQEMEVYHNYMNA